MEDSETVIDRPDEKSSQQTGSSVNYSKPTHNRGKAFSLLRSVLYDDRIFPKGESEPAILISKDEFQYGGICVGEKIKRDKSQSVGEGSFEATSSAKRYVNDMFCSEFVEEGLKQRTSANNVETLPNGDAEASEKHACSTEHKQPPDEREEGELSPERFVPIPSMKLGDYIRSGPTQRGNLGLSNKADSIQNKFLPDYEKLKNYAILGDAPLLMLLNNAMEQILMLKSHLKIKSSPAITSYRSRTKGSRETVRDRSRRRYLNRKREDSRDDKRRSRRSSRIRRSPDTGTRISKSYYKTSSRRENYDREKKNFSNRSSMQEPARQRARNNSDSKSKQQWFDRQRRRSTPNRDHAKVPFRSQTNIEHQTIRNQQSRRNNLPKREQRGAKREDQLKEDKRVKNLFRRQMSLISKLIKTRKAIEPKKIAVKPQTEKDIRKQQDEDIEKYKNFNNLGDAEAFLGALKAKSGKHFPSNDKEHLDDGSSNVNHHTPQQTLNVARQPEARKPLTMFFTSKKKYAIQDLQQKFLEQTDKENLEELRATSPVRALKNIITEKPQEPIEIFNEMTGQLCDIAAKLNEPNHFIKNFVDENETEYVNQIEPIAQSKPHEENEQEVLQPEDNTKSKERNTMKRAQPEDKSKSIPIKRRKVNKISNNKNQNTDINNTSNIENIIPIPKIPNYKNIIIICDKKDNVSDTLLRLKIIDGNIYFKKTNIKASEGIRYSDIKKARYRNRNQWNEAPEIADHPNATLEQMEDFLNHLRTRKDESIIKEQELLIPEIQKEEAKYLSKIRAKRKARFMAAFANSEKVTERETKLLQDLKQTKGKMNTATEDVENQDSVDKTSHEKEAVSVAVSIS